VGERRYIRSGCLSFEATNFVIQNTLRFHRQSSSPTHSHTFTAIVVTTLTFEMNSASVRAYSEDFFSSNSALHMLRPSLTSCHPLQPVHPGTPHLGHRHRDCRALFPSKAVPCSKHHLEHPRLDQDRFQRQTILTSPQRRIRRLDCTHEL
jgi:hypothetical protein